MRALRFYDQIGLLSPRQRSEAGYRLYSEADLARLQQISALKFLGFSLDQIQSFLQADQDGLPDALAKQCAMLRDQRKHLDTIIRATEKAEALARDEPGDWDPIVTLIQATQMTHTNEWRRKYFTDDQLKSMDELGQKSYSREAESAMSNRPVWTEDDQKRVDEQYAALYAGVREAVAASEAPDSARGQELAGQAIGLIEAFTQGNAPLTAGLNEWWKGFEALPRDQKPFQIPLNEEEAAFLEKAKAIYQQQRGGSEAAS